MLITTPIALMIDEQDVLALRAEDESCSFGILDSHADFVTALALSPKGEYRFDTWAAPSIDGLGMLIPG
jgi:hypothetical protein